MTILTCRRFFAPSSARDDDDAGASETAASDSSGAVSVPADGHFAAAWRDSGDEAEAVDLAHGASRLRKLRRTDTEAVVSGDTLSRRLREQFARVNGAASWASLPAAGGGGRRGSAASQSSQDGDDGDDGVGDAGGDDDDDDDDGVSLLRRDARPLTVTSAGGTAVAGSAGERRGVVRPGRLDVARVANGNVQDECECAVRTVRFHPSGELLLTAGFDKRVRLFHVDGVRNARVQSVFFADMPVATARFSPDGAEVIASGRRRFFYTYDLRASRVEKVPSIFGREEKSLERFELSPDGRLIAFLGNDGNTVLVSRRTRQWCATVKMNGSVRAVAFDPAGRYLRTAGGDGEVYLWDLRMGNRCVSRQADDGAVHTTCLDWSPTGSHLASGSDSGVVNLYNASAASSSAPDAAPGTAALIKPLMNLTTEITAVRFNHDAQLLAFASKGKRDALRVAHVASGTVFSNWPTGKTPLGSVSSLDFSPHSGYLAVGNDKGKVLLFRLKHYGLA
jgi:U3 small nucleolar RNA-associated protein 18